MFLVYPQMQKFATFAVALQ